jgi:group I intron endonuclease
MITNTVNKKQYVGITKDIEARWYDHKRNRSSSVIQRAIKKYGVDAFIFEHIADAFNWHNACEIEKFLIIQHNTKSPNGYNLTDGGDGGTGYKFSQEEIERRRQRATGSNNPMFGIKNPFKGRTHSEETKAKMKAAWAIRRASGWIDPRIGKKRKQKETA